MFDGRNRRFGGTPRVLLSVLSEIAVSTLIAPIMLCFQSKAVFEILFGLDGGWPATQRGSSRIEFGTAFAASWWIVLVGAITLAFAIVFAPDMVPWLLPVTGPAIAAPALIVLTSLGRAPAGRWSLFATPSALAPDAVILDQHAIYAAWTVHGPELPQGEPANLPVNSHVHA